MTEMSEPRAVTSSENTHWGIAYLREDLQELRTQMREDSKESRTQIAEINQLLNQRIDETNKRIDETNKLINSRFTWLVTTMVALTGILIAVIKL